MAQEYDVYETSTNHYVGQQIYLTTEVQRIESAGFTLIPTNKTSQEVTQ